jgi:hypothetical protein
MKIVQTLSAQSGWTSLGAAMAGQQVEIVQSPIAQFDRRIVGIRDRLAPLKSAKADCVTL